MLGYMPLQQHHVDQLKALYQKERGVILSDAEAWEMAIRLINLFRLLLDMPKDRGSKVRTI
jgi:PIN domain nuclease of toxin-antitoxin system